MQNQPNIEQLIDIVLSAAPLMTEAHLSSSDVSDKEGAGNFVTRFDVAVQAQLMAEFSRLIPEAEFFAEEKENAALTDAPTFIIDPIDGTTNFILDMRHSCISVALCVKRQTEVGIVYDPYQDELFYAVRGQGAYLRRGGREWPLSVRAEDPPEHALIVFGTDPYHKNQTGKWTSALFSAALDAFMDLRRPGSAALDLCYLAAGRAHGFFEIALSPWDYAAGALIIREAGGVLTDAAGDIPLDTKCPIFAGTPTVHRVLLHTVLPAARAALGEELPLACSVSSPSHPNA